MPTNESTNDCDIDTEKAGQTDLAEYFPDFCTHVLTNVLFSFLNLRLKHLASILYIETEVRREREYLPPILSNYNKRYDRFLQKPQKSFLKQLIVGMALHCELKRMSDKLIPKGLKDHKVERGYTKGLQYHTYLLKMRLESW